MYVCICHAVTEEEILDVVDAGAYTEIDVSDMTAAGTGCGSCLPRIGELIEGSLACPLRGLAAIA